MPAFPIAYLLTWSTYGTWLHGDARGSVDDENNRFGWPRLRECSERVSREMRLLRHEPLALSPSMRGVVRDAIVERCEFLGVAFAALNVRTTHVHLVVRANGAPERLLQGFKARTTRVLREGGHVGAEQPVWTEGGSTRWLWSAEDLTAATAYVHLEQGTPDEFGERGGDG